MDVASAAYPCRKRGLPRLGNVNGKGKRRKLDLIVLERRSRILKQCRNTLANGPEVNKLLKVVNVSAGDPEKLFAAENPKAKSSVEGCRKRGLLGVGYGPEEKRQKSVRDAIEQCSSILKKLMSTAPSELKRQRERERKAARLALQQVEKTIAFDDNSQVLKDFHMSTQCSLSKQYRGFQGSTETISGLIECCHWVILLKMSSRKG
ncbi:hypothetical protein RHMOL_Rhmol12G0184900 [Rhododendron molle]|uniref:Uncharacterized protein n=1 Tax=Rhododendron molle TaxID=49168 RepID=A0ACC0LJW3_RHOML|nr:hypothetical protein RHMOL_Rhmol12G0184900 [Rhododendron molle]